MRYTLSISVDPTWSAEQAQIWAAGVVKANLAEADIVDAERIEGSVLVTVDADDPRPLHAWRDECVRRIGGIGRLLWYGTAQRAAQLRLALG